MPEIHVEDGHDVRGIRRQRAQHRIALLLGVTPLVRCLVGLLEGPCLGAAHQQRVETGQQAAFAHAAQDPEDLPGTGHVLGGVQEQDAALVRCGVALDPAVGHQQPGEDLEVAAPGEALDDPLGLVPDPSPGGLRSRLGVEGGRVGPVEIGVAVAVRGVELVGT